MTTPYRSLLPREFILKYYYRRAEGKGLEEGKWKGRMRIKSFALLMVAYGNPVHIIYKENLWLCRRNAKQKQAATRFKYK
jgi:hypothetical protein